MKHLTHGIINVLLLLNFQILLFCLIYFDILVTFYMYLLAK